MDEVKPLSPPKANGADRAMAVGKSMLSDIIPLGGTFGELAGMFIRTPYQKRTEEWQEQVGEALYRLATAKGVDLEALQRDQRFVDTVFHATQVAIRNANEEKRAALRNAIVNAGLPSAPDESQRQMFLNYIDTFTPWHLRLLALFDDPPRWFREQENPWPNIIMGARDSILEAAYPEVKQDPGFFRQVWRDLYTDGLVGSDSLSGMVSERGLAERGTTDAGRQFLEFIGGSDSESA